MGDGDCPNHDAELLAEIRGLRADLREGVPIRPPSAKTIALIIAIGAAVVPGGNAIATRILSAFAGAPTVTVAPNGGTP